MKKHEESLVEKTKTKWDNSDKKRISLNAKAMKILFCALSMDEFNQIQTCKHAKDIWNNLVEVHV